MLKLKKIAEDLYEAAAFPPDTGEAWSTTEPIGARELINQLMKRGAHVVDIHDALRGQDADWDRKARRPSP